METQTLNEWITAEGITPLKRDDASVVILDNWATPPSALWRLSDYFVSSVGAGVIWLLPFARA